MNKIRISTDDFDAGAEIAALAKKGGGAVASFVGQVRADNDLVALELEHYPSMTEKSLNEIAEKASEKWVLHGITIMHRVGKLEPGEQIVLVCTASDHRQEAFDACSYIMDYLKTAAPFWKKEWQRDGSAAWVEERQSDIDATRSWEK